MSNFATGPSVHIAGWFMLGTVFCLASQMMLLARTRLGRRPRTAVEWLLVWDWAGMGMVAVILFCRGLAVLWHDKLNLMADALAFAMAFWQSGCMIRRLVVAWCKRGFDQAMSTATLDELRDYERRLGA